jgi:hypothetical protein
MGWVKADFERAPPTRRGFPFFKPLWSALSRGWEGLGMATQIALVEDGPGSYRFSFTSTRGELSGRVTVGTEGPPDRRSYGDREQAARNQILALSREFSMACGD